MNIRGLFPAGLITLQTLALVWSFSRHGVHAHFNSQDGVESVVASVNGEPISRSEVDLQVSLLRSRVFRYFRQKHGDGITNDKGFWTTSHDGEIPAEVAQAWALENLKRIKLEQTLARERGIVSDIRYRAIQENRIQENKRREEVLRSGGVIYGPERFNEQAWFDYCHSHMVEALKKALARDELRVSEDELKKHYLDIRERHFKRTDSVKAIVVRIPYDPGGRSDRGDALASIKAAQEWLRNGEAVRNASLRVKGTVAEKVFGEATERKDAMEEPDLIEAARALKPGSISDIHDDGRSFFIIKCQERKDQGYRPYPEVSSIVREKLVDMLYDNYIDSLARECKMLRVNGHRL
ncbi:MAG TPA: hypothetical protein VJ385_06515 [Fibrobacteria bacterium]|nr:hypothetical protein [Fibrobacteria bacterium]